MSDRVSVSTDAIRSAATGFSAAGDEAGRIGQGLRAQIEGIGNVWGDDKSGKKFETEYVPSRDEVLAACTSLSTTLLSVCDNLRTMARNYEQTEQANVDAITGGDPGAGA